jgi:hydroxymethylpyrimidine/phosphomethylpyrimidine kinase
MRGVTAWEPVSTELVIAQMGTVGAEFTLAAVKTFMLATAAINSGRRHDRRDGVSEPGRSR